MEFSKDENGKIWIQDNCKRCGYSYADIKEGKGPHIAEIRCRDCGGHMKWMSKGEYEVYQCYLTDAPEENIMMKIGNAVLAVKEAEDKGDWIEARVSKKNLKVLEDAFEKMPNYAAFTGFAHE